MKRISAIMILATILLAAVAATAGAALINQRLHSREIPAQPQYTAYNIQTPNWWPH